MIRIVLKGPGGDVVAKLDTPDPALLGIWLKAIFDQEFHGLRAGPIPLTYTLEVW